MATKKQQQLKKKQRDFKKKKAAQSKAQAAREEGPADGDRKSQGVTRNQFGGKSSMGQQAARSGNQMHRPQGG
jgi:hypothetical protein